MDTYRSASISPARAAALFAAIALLLPFGLNRTAKTAPNPNQESSQKNQPVKLVPSYRQADRIAVLTVKGEIDQITLQSLERRVAEAIEQEFDAIVLDIHTPGGRIDSARDIGHLLKHDSPVNTVAWVNYDAYSAGTILTLSCREIVVHPDAFWGGCAPIQVGMGGLVPMPEGERAKMESYLRADVVDAARRHGYDEKLVEAFISFGVELWMLENTTTGDRVFVDSVEYERVFGEAPPKEIASVKPAVIGTAPPKPPQAFYNPHQFNDDKWERMTPEEREIASQKIIAESQTRPPSRALLTAADKNKWKLLGQVISNDKLLVIKAEESLDYGFAKAVIENDKELLEFFGASEMVRMDASWSEHLVRFLVNTWVRGILIVIFLIALFVETAAPGFGLFGALAGLSLMVLIGAPYLVGMAQWWEILLIALGIVLIAAEIFVIPGFGVAGIAGVLCLLVGTVGTFISGDISSAEGMNELATGLIATIAAFATAGVGVWMLTRHLYDVPWFRRLVLNTSVDSRSAEDMSQSLLMAMGPDANEELASGDTGIAETDLRPSGKVRFGEKSVDVVTPGGYIQAGTQVRVISVDRFRIEVEAAD